MKKESNIVKTDHGLYEKSSGRKIISPICMTVFSPVQKEIIIELSRTFDRLGAERGVFAALHSWGDTLPDEEIVKMLKELNG